MKLKVISETSDSMVLELSGEQHTFPTILCWALLKDPRVDFAVYDVDHPLVGTPRLHLRTNRKKPRNALVDAVKLLESEFKEIGKQFDKKAKPTPKVKKKTKKK